MKTALVVVDVNDLFYKLGKRYAAKLNYEKYLACIADQYHIFQAIAYGTIFSEATFNFIKVLNHIGFKTVFSPPPQNQKVINWNLALSLDIIRVLDKIDVAVIGSSDTSLIPLHQYLKERGQLVHIYAVNISKQLRETIDTCSEITTELLGESNVETSPAQ